MTNCVVRSREVRTQRLTNMVLMRWHLVFSVSDVAILDRFWKLPTSSCRSCPSSRTNNNEDLYPKSQEARGINSSVFGCRLIFTP
jgi:hypothetical protein